MFGSTTWILWVSTKNYTYVEPSVKNHLTENDMIKLDVAVTEKTPKGLKTGNSVG